MRDIFSGSNTGEVSSNPSIPALASISASVTVATDMPIAPAAICLRAISTHLCALACGRRFLPVRFTCAAMRARLDSNASRFSNSAGVGISCLLDMHGIILMEPSMLRRLFLLISVCGAVSAAPRLRLTNTVVYAQVAVGANAPDQALDAYNIGDGSLSLTALIPPSVTWLAVSIGPAHVCNPDGRARSCVSL